MQLKTFAEAITQITDVVSQTIRIDTINSNHRKDNKLHKSLQVINHNAKAYGNNMRQSCIDIRWYWPGDVCYCCVWVHTEGIYISTSAKAGGYGYCKESASFANALHAAKIECKGVSGVGSTAVESWVHNAAKLLLGHENFSLVRAYA